MTPQNRLGAVSPQKVALYSPEIVQCSMKNWDSWWGSGNAALLMPWRLLQLG